MNEATKKKFQDATVGLNLTGAQKKALVAFYADDIAAGDIEALPTAVFRVLIREKIRQLAWKETPVATDGEA